jgi:anti-anti-sigma regulatory factor
MSCATAVALISLARTAAEAGGAVIIRAPTGAFTDAFADLGLFEPLMNMQFAE